MTVTDAVLLGVVEGLTELLPVSSTGHLILLGKLLGHQSDAHKALDVVIQLGAVLAIAGYFRARLVALGRGLYAREPASVRVLVALGLAFLPAALIGLAVHGWIKDNLFGPRPVAGALCAGGVLMIAVELWRARRAAQDGLEAISPRSAMVVGAFQAISLWPGSSRSMTTIVGAQLCGLSLKTAAEFSFLLALPTLGAATLFDLYQHGGAILAMPSGGVALGVGMAVSFAVTWVVIALFLRYVTRVGLMPFAVYRIALGIAVLWLSR